MDCLIPHRRATVLLNVFESMCWNENKIIKLLWNQFTLLAPDIVVKHSFTHSLAVLEC